MEAPKQRSSSFDEFARVASASSFSGSILTLIVFFWSSGRGIEATTHWLLGLMFVAQIGVLFLFVFAAVYLAASSNGLRLTRIGALMIVIAIVALVGQFLALQHISVVGSSVP
jgi:hypothetical protein